MKAPAPDAEATDAEVAAFMVRLFDGTATADDVKRQAVALHYPGHLAAVVAMSAEALDSLLAFKGGDAASAIASWCQSAFAASPITRNCADTN